MLIPGKKICPNCRAKVTERIKLGTIEYDNDDTTGDNEEEESFIREIQSITTVEKCRDELEECFSAIGITPLKMHSQTSKGKLPYSKKKITTAVETITEKVATTLKIEKQELEHSKITPLQTEIIDKAQQFDRLMELVKDKISNTLNTPDKIQLLTLAPLTWTIPHTMSYFSVSEYAVKEARKLLQQKGILAKPDKKTGKYLSDETIKLVVSFYEDDENSRQMPGKKDYVSVSRNIHKQKRLILLTLRELYSSFKEKHPSVKIGFSKFCDLRPKWCILAGASGTHSVCVCVYHENMKLMLAPIHADYKDLFEFIVCGKMNKE